MEVQRNAAVGVAVHDGGTLHGVPGAHVEIWFDADVQSGIPANGYPLTGDVGGTCFGDSGGPNFLGDTNVVAGVTSFGLNSTCGGTGGVYRVDRSDDLDRLYGTFGSYLP